MVAGLHLSGSPLQPPWRAFIGGAIVGNLALAPPRALGYRGISTGFLKGPEKLSNEARAKLPSSRLARD